jgi:hypothetical protein
VCGRHHVEEVLVEVCADQLSTARAEAGGVQLLEEGGDLALLDCGCDRNQGMARILSGGGN